MSNTTPTLNRAIAAVVCTRGHAHTLNVARFDVIMMLRRVRCTLSRVIMSCQRRTPSWTVKTKQKVHEPQDMSGTRWATRRQGHVGPQDVRDTLGHKKSGTRWATRRQGHVRFLGQKTRVLQAAGLHLDICQLLPLRKQVLSLLDKGHRASAIRSLCLQEGQESACPKRSAVIM